MKIKAFLSFLCCAALTGCATTYQPDGTDGTGGHSFRRFSENTFQVEFAGNGFTPPKKARDFAMLRAAELCMQHNFRFFSVMAEESKGRTEFAEMGGTSYTTGTANTFGGLTTYSGTTTSYPTRIPIHKPRQSIMITCYVSPPGGHAGPVKDAQQVAGEIRARYKIKLGD